MNMHFEKNNRILFMGDSITDCNRDYGAVTSWGEGYVNVINAYTTAFLPEKELMIVNRGVSGDTILKMARRWEKDVLDFGPDWVTVMIGVNDVWRHYDGVFCQEEMVSLSQFETVYRNLIEKTLPSVQGMILLSPFMVELRQDDSFRQEVDDYRAVAEKLSKEYGLIYGNVQEKIDKFLTHQSSYVLSPDRVHPSLAGHFMIAKTWLEAVGLEN